MTGYDEPDDVDLKIPARDLRAWVARARGYRTLIEGIVADLAVTHDDALFNEEILAFVRGGARALATEILRRQATLATRSGSYDDTYARSIALSELLLRNAELRRLLHVSAIDATLCHLIADRSHTDPVLSPALVALADDTDDRCAGLAMAAMSAQALFLRNHRRKTIALLDLPAEILHATLLDTRSFPTEIGDEDIARAELLCRTEYSEASTRLAIFDALVDCIDDRFTGSLTMDSMGVPLFLSTLARRIDQSYASLVFAAAQRTAPNFGLCLKSAGLSDAEIFRHFDILGHDDAAKQDWSAVDIGSAGKLLLAAFEAEMV